jgi:DNA-binding NarL/FixJ family response regulator
LDDHEALTESPTVPLRVAIVDDHPVFREGTAALLAREADIEVVGLGASLEDARGFLSAADPPHVLLLDVRLGDESGLRLLDGVAGRSAIVIFTAYDYPQYADAALAQGAAGFVPKSAPTGQLLDAIRRAATGELTFRRRAGGSAPALTARELEVIHLVADGLSNDEIGGRLGVTAKTIEGHLGRIFVRTGVRSRTELATTAVRQGWLDLPGRIAPP